MVGRQAKTHQLATRYTEAEYELLGSVARLKGLSLGGWIRSSALQMTRAEVARWCMQHPAASRKHRERT